MQARHIRQIHQRHPRLFRRPVPLAPVAGAAGRDAVHPAVLPLAGHRLNVFPRQLLWMKPMPAIRADMPVAGEEFGIGECRRLPPGAAGNRAADRDDGVQLDAGLQPGDPLIAAAQHMARLAQCPGDCVAGVEHGGFLGRDPGLRAARDIQLQNIHGR